MANPLKGEFTITTSNGEALTLRLTMNEVIELQDEFGEDIVAHFVRGKLSFKQVRSVLYRALKTHHPDVTLARAGELMTDLGMKRVHEAWTSAVTAAFGSGEKDPKGVVAIPIPGTGTGSSTTPSPPA